MLETKAGGIVLSTPPKISKVGVCRDAIDSYLDLGIQMEAEVRPGPLWLSAIS